MPTPNKGGVHSATAAGDSSNVSKPMNPCLIDLLSDRDSELRRVGGRFRDDSRSIHNNAPDELWDYKKRSTSAASSVGRSSGHMWVVDGRRGLRRVAPGST
jgi:hypothetical protein